jgi:DNA-binding NarL/FixJ family response regulator
MFKNVLVVDDHNAVNYGIVQTLKKHTKIAKIAFSQDCDSAYIKFQKAQLDGTPFDLVITDMGFKENYHDRNIKSGKDLIKTLRKKQPNIKIIVYSIEDRDRKVQALIDQYNINGFISKGKYGLQELLEALPNVYNNILYTSKALDINRQKKKSEIDEVDIMILEELANGTSQKDMAKIFQQRNTKSPSLSSIEKKIGALKIRFKAKNTIHLVATCKDLGII